MFCFLHFNVNNTLGLPSSVQDLVGRMVTWRLAKPPGNHVTPWWLKAKDPNSGRTVTFGETRHKKVHARPHMWVAATPSAAQRMAALLRNFLAGRLQALSQTNVFLFSVCKKTCIFRAFYGLRHLDLRRLARCLCQAQCRRHRHRIRRRNLQLSLTLRTMALTTSSSTKAPLFG